jgi:AcrR family transcriptional regulator
MQIENKKLQHILQASRRLFWKYGLKRVSVEEICSESGVSKMTFYKHFANKTELAKYILDMFFNESVAAYRKIVDSDQPFTERIKSAVEYKMNNTFGISQELINELYKSGKPEIMAFIQEWSTRSVNIVVEDFRLWQARGEIRPEIKPEFILFMLSKMADITTDESLSRLYADPGEMIRELTNFLFYGLMPINNEKKK